MNSFSVETSYRPGICNDSLVMEIGLYNLTNDEVPALIHFDADRREPRTLIRLKNPEEQAGK